MNKKYQELIISLRLSEEADIVTASGVVPTDDGFTRDPYADDAWRGGN